MADENEDVKTESRDAVAAVYAAYEKAGPEAGLLGADDVEPAEPTDPAKADKEALGGDPDRAREVEEEDREEEKPAADKARDEKTGRFAKQAEKPVAKAPTIRKGGPAAPATPQEQPGAVPPPVPAAPASRTTRAPQSWRPAAREGFDKLPAPVREEVWRLEGEREKVVREGASHRRFNEEWQRTIAPFEQAIRASGVEPLQAVGNVMRTVHSLGTQPEPIRARIIREIMRSYGVTAESLADAIDEVGGAQPQRAGPQPTYDPRFDQFYAQYQADRQAQERDRQAQEQAVNAQADTELAEFAKDHEFLDDVLPEMFDFMDVASRRGIAMDYETAYSRAIALRPDLLEVLQQREAAAASPDGPTQRALRASSSVRGSPARRPAPGEKKFADSREAAAAAYDAHTGDGGRV